MAGSPSKSTIFQPRLVRRVWPRCRSPWTCCTVEAGQRAHPVVRRAQGVGVRRQLGHDVERGVEPGGHRVGERGRGVGAAALGREVLGQHGVHLAQRLAEPGGLAGEVAAGLVGVQVGLGEEVAGAGEREVPAVAGGAQELLEHRELHGRAAAVVGVVGVPSTQSSQP